MIPVDPMAIFNAHPEWKTVRIAAKVLALDAMMQALDGETELALANARAMLNVAASMEDSGTMVSTLVLASCEGLAIRSVERTLSMGVCADAVLEGLAVTLGEREQPDALLWGVWGERARQNATFEQLRGGATLPPSQMPVFSGGVPLPLRGWNKLDQAKTLSFVNRLVRIAGIPPEKMLPATEEFEQEVASVSRFYLMTRITMSSYSRTIVLWVKHIAELRCARTALAVERYRMAHGRWPGSLDALVPEFLEAVPLDPFDSKPLRYLVTEDMVTVYSLNDDDTDDNGKLERSGSGATYDLGFRLLSPERRGAHMNVAVPTTAPAVESGD
ncbi:MAG: hypothetical protein GY842_20760 [bacterium]|nr:hypothetical protein [bacterium]